MHVIDLKGTAQERGYQQGRILKQTYRKMIEHFFSSEFWKSNKPDILPDYFVKRLLGLVGIFSIREAVRTNLPRQFDRIRGLGRGLGIGPDFVWGMQYMEIMFCEAGNSLKAPISGGCTQIHATPAATADRIPLASRNYDFPNVLKNYQFVRREKPSEKGRLASLSVTHIPIAGTHQGINEAGLMVAANNARIRAGRDLKKRGVPYELILQEILETCRSVPEAVDYIAKFPKRSNAGFFGFTDESGDCKVVEFTASRHAVREPDETGILVQTNHYHKLEDANLPEGTTWNVEGMIGIEYAESTRTRYNVAHELAAQSAGKIDIEILKNILRDHSANNGVGSDITVCVHGLSGSTLASIIADVKNRELWIAEGNPCENEYMRVPLSI